MRPAPPRRRPALTLALAAAGAGLLGAIAHRSAPTPDLPPPRSSLVFLEQRWGSHVRDPFYRAPIGSRLFPYRWFFALERAGASEHFAGAKSLARHGWIALPKSPSNPDGLPIGFAKDPVDQPITGPWVGLTCAACHTAEITYHGQRVRIDGAPSQVDFGLFLADLGAAVKATRESAQKFRRFAAEVYGHDPSAEDLGTLSRAFAEVAVAIEAEVLARTPPISAGPGRIDALGQTINAIAAMHLHDPYNLRPPIAPVSIPALWITADHDRTQEAPAWTPPIARDVAHVLGFFGVADLRDPSRPMRSSALIPQIRRVEAAIAALEPPPWPTAIFGPIDAAMAAKGKALFDRDCRACHGRSARVEDKEVGTDALRAEHLATRLARTGALGPALFGGRTVVPAVDLVTAAVQAIVDQSLDGPPAPRASAESGLPSPTARPLAGIWATGPYLHNGSVPNLDELLSPPADRSTEFWVGGVEIDPDKVGFRSLPGELTPEEEATRFRFDTTLPGNHNTGHAYPPVPYSRQDRRAVIEYLKDLR